MKEVVGFQELLDRREKLTKNWMGKTINKRDKREIRLGRGKRGRGGGLEKGIFEFEG